MRQRWGVATLWIPSIWAVQCRFISHDAYGSKLGSPKIRVLDSFQNDVVQNPSAYRRALNIYLRLELAKVAGTP